jgi:hypothetical protein
MLLPLNLDVMPAVCSARGRFAPLGALGAGLAGYQPHLQSCDAAPSHLPLLARCFICPCSLCAAVVESLLRYFITAPPVPLSQKIYRYMPTDTRSVLKIVRTAAGELALPCPARRLPGVDYYTSLPCPAGPD